jgi:hypothetical protein
VNLDGGCAGGIDLNGGHAVEAHMEEERGACVEAVDAASRQMRRRSEHQWVCGGEMTWLGFRSSGTLRNKNSSDGHDDVINARRYI